MSADLLALPRHPASLAPVASHNRDLVRLLSRHVTPDMVEFVAQRASELINKLPSSPSLITKTGSAILGSGLIATAISQELYVVNEETVILAGFVVLVTFIAKVRSATSRGFSPSN